MKLATATAETIEQFHILTALREMFPENYLAEISLIDRCVVAVADHSGNAGTYTFVDKNTIRFKPYLPPEGEYDFDTLGPGIFHGCE